MEEKSKIAQKKSLPPWFNREAGSAFSRLAQLLTTIFSFATLIRVSFLHLGQYRGILRVQCLGILLYEFFFRTKGRESIRILLTLRPFKPPLSENDLP